LYQFNNFCFNQLPNDTAWVNDRRNTIKATIAHELGHGIGMEERYIADPNIPYLMGLTQFDTLNGDRIITLPLGFYPEYSDPSKSEITIMEGN
jgi:hypothetical protein